MECFLDRLSRSEYRNSFVLKGGVLVGAIFGSALRSTMDIDQTVKGVSLNKQDAERIIQKIIEVPSDDGVLFSFDGSSPIMDNRDYPGLRVHLTATLDQSRIPVLIDLYAGDAITPKEIGFSYQRIFGGSISLLAYPPETLAAEKLETILSRGTANTRMKDFYDVVLFLERKDFLNPEILKKAFLATTAKRSTGWILIEARSIVQSINDSKTMEKRWNSFQNSYLYASSIEWSLVADSLHKLASMVLE